MEVPFRPFRPDAPLVQDQMNAGKPPLMVLIYVGRDIPPVINTTRVIVSETNGLPTEGERVRAIVGRHCQRPDTEPIFEESGKSKLTDTFERTSRSQRNPDRRR